MDDRQMCTKEEILASVQDDEQVQYDGASMQDSQVTSNIVTQLSDISETIITSLSHANNNIMTPQGQIIITSDGIVFPSGGLMIPNQSENSSLKDDLQERITTNENVDNNDYDIKVESNSLQSSSYSTTKSNSTFAIDQSVLQNLADNDSDLTQITFSEGDHITQFHIQLPLSITDVQNLRNVNKNVFFSQAAVEKIEDNGNIGDGSSRKPGFLIQTASMKNTSAKSDITKVSSNKDYLGSFSTGETSFIKTETASAQHALENNTFHRNSVKSENLMQTVTPGSESDTNPNGPYSQIVYVQVDSSQQLIPISVTPAPTTTIKRPAEKDFEEKKDDSKKKRKTRKAKLPTILPKDVPKETDKLRSLAPRLLSYPLYAGAQASIGTGKSLLKSYDITTMNIVEGGQYFEVLGRCTQCFRFSRTTSYCRAEKNHRDPKSSVCHECEFNGLSTVVCRRKLNHAAPNAQPLNIVINTALQNAEHVKQLCIRNMLPPCFSELHSIVIHHADITFVAQRIKENLDHENPSETIPHVPRKSTDYARGYLYPYSKEKWDEWLGKFCQQTGTTFRIRTGKRVNKKSDHGLANHNGRIISYRTLETQLYNCSLGGKPRKRRPKDGTKKRKERCSRLIGCPGVIHTRLLETELQWRALEVTAPKISAHLSCHDPRLVPGNVFGCDDILLSNINSAILQQCNQDLDGIQQVSQQQSESPSLPPVSQTSQHETLSLHQHGDQISVEQTTNQIDPQKSDVNMTDVKNNTKTILLTCVSLLDSLNSTESLRCLETSAQDMLAYIFKEAHKQQTLTTRVIKRMKDESNSIMDIEMTSPSRLDPIVE